MKDIDLYFIRHGQTEWNLNNQLQGSQGAPLTQEGIDTAKVTGRHLSNIHFTKAYSSPLSRAIETRDYIINEQHDISTVDKQELAYLTEMDYGCWDGGSIPELKKTPEFMMFLNEPEKFDSSITGGENYFDILARMQKAIDKIVSEAPNRGNILVVSHGHVLRLILCVLNGGDWRKHRIPDYFPTIFNTSISIINYKQKNKDETGKFSTKLLNSIEHLNN